MTEHPRLWRYFLIAVFVIPILIVLPHARTLVIRNAVVTAYLHELNSPIEGKITGVSLAAGDRLEESAGGISVHNDRLDASGVARLEKIKLGAEAESARRARQLETLRELAQTRETELDQYIGSVGQELGKRLRILNDEAVATRSALTEAESNLNRVRKLHEDGLLSQADLEAADAIYQRALSDHSANQLERDRISEQLEEIRMGVFQVDVPDGALLTRQSLESVWVEIMDMENALGSSLGNLETVSAELDRAREAFMHASRAELNVPPGKTVWDVYVAPGTWVAPGERLASFVDCSDLLLDIAVDDATLSLIEPGLKVRTRLFGSLRYYEGEVVLVRGSGGLEDSAPLAAQIENRGFRKGRVMARVDASELGEQGESSCGIGRTAYAEFEGIGMFELLLYPLFR